MAYTDAHRQAAEELYADEGGWHVCMSVNPGNGNYVRHGCQLENAFGYRAYALLTHVIVRLYLFELLDNGMVVLQMWPNAWNTVSLPVWP